MRTRGWIGGVAVVVIAIALAAGRADGIAIRGGTSAQRAMARWAIDRFASAGLPLPPLEIRFHREVSGCDDRLGSFEDGVANFCGVHANSMSRRTMLHELAHGWVDARVPGDLRERFMRLRQLETWNDHRVEWEGRGTEHAAEIIGWALNGHGDGTDLASIPNNTPSKLAVAYRLLTGRPLPLLAGVPVDFVV